VTALAIATPHAAATRAGADAVAAGGNAVDVALVAAVVLAVAYPHYCGVGGDLFALVRQRDGTVVSIDGSGAAPAAVDADAQRAKGAHMPLWGPDAITVPGAVGGWAAVHAAGAALPWAAILDPAIALARDGVPVSESVARTAEQFGHVLDRDPGMRSLFAGVRAGDGLRQPALAATLERIAADGPDALYRGDVGTRLVDGLRAAGSVLSAGDLAAFAPTVTAPLRARFGDLELLTSPPGSAGVLLLQALIALDASGARDPLGDDAGVLAELLRLGGEQRDRQLADPRAVPFVRGDWLGADRIAELVASARGAGRAGHAHVRAPRPIADTVAVVTADDEGRAVSLVQSLFYPFGAGVLEPATGIIAHDRGAAFSLEPGHPNELAPCRRPAHTLTPVIVQREGALAYVLGTSGGRGHAQIISQVLLRLLAGDDPQAAVDAPRWAVGGLAPSDPQDDVPIEDGVPRDAVRALGRTGAHTRIVQRGREFMGHAQAITARSGASLAAGSDRRGGDGAALLR
jgi:gamma-glutamyltranspeptidase/glutathione hydrolase